MSVFDNQLNWRRVWPGPGVDVSSWTVAKRMALPDWCFGGRQVISARVAIFAADTFGWAISDVALPDPCCIWQVGIIIRQSDHRSNYLRMGLLDNVPTSEGDMDNAVEILPDFGSSSNTPERIYLFDGGPVYIEPQVRMGLATASKKLVVEGKVYADGTALLGMIHVVVSELPTVIPVFFNPEIPG